MPRVVVILAVAADADAEEIATFERVDAAKLAEEVRDNEDPRLLGASVVTLGAGDGDQLRALIQEVGVDSAELGIDPADF